MGRGPSQLLGGTCERQQKGYGKSSKQWGIGGVGKGCGWGTGETKPSLARVTGKYTSMGRDITGKPLKKTRSRTYGRRVNQAGLSSRGAENERKGARCPKRRGGYGGNTRHKMECLLQKRPGGRLRLRNDKNTRKRARSPQSGTGSIQNMTGTLEKSGVVRKKGIQVGGLGDEKVARREEKGGGGYFETKIKETL